ncbi:hypothetical protein [Tritonibacter mobilis]|uniref:hypothetical protein n=1 Tax=Tritonibacter mobilis TaxID=379347 RepID=UPI000E0CD8F6|nr:hypothetical protein [Tritonibacter mobilis]
MSKSPRLVLGPVARQLIGSETKELPKVLDDAITTLMEERDQRPDATSPEGRLASLEAAVKAQSEALQQLSYVATLEMKMTRVLIASLMSKTDEDQQALITLANSAVQELHEKARVISDSDMEKLRENDASVQTAIQRDIERGALEQEQETEEELER